jgi:cell division septation protein DedD
MATTTNDGFHEIQLNGKQLVFLFMAVTVVSVVIFLCGVLVGRGVRTGPTSDQVLAQNGAPPTVDPPAPTVSTGSDPSPASQEEVSYPDRLGKEEVARERLQRNPPSASAAPRVEPRPPTPAAVPATSATPAATRVAAEPAGPGFAIQLAALGKRDEADGIARRLTGKGYPAYVITPDSGSPAVFRVRVGKFKDRKEAESVAARLQKEEQFNPWIVR